MSRMPDYEAFIDNNRKLWDGMVPVHVASQFYDVASFKAGRNALMQVERDEVGDVAGKSLLHLQCHFGMDTLSWARLGARVTGVDFSSPAIAQARELAAQLGIDATFIESDVYKLPDVLQGVFDVVFASHGVVCWLPDFHRWAEIAAGYVKPGGAFYLIESHPFSATLDDSRERPHRVRYPYQTGGIPMVFDDDGSYADREAVLPHKRSYEFHHGIGDIVTALIDAGLQIEFLHEFPFCAWQRFPDMTKGGDGYYHLPDEGALPLLFSVKASKPH
jgi:SAM-dependent methyltransferase